MTVPSKVDVDAATRETLAGLALSDPELLLAVAPQVGGPRVVAAAPELMIALGLSLPAGVDGDDAE